LGLLNLGSNTYKARFELVSFSQNSFDFDAIEYENKVSPILDLMSTDYGLLVLVLSFFVLILTSQVSIAEVPLYLIDETACLALNGLCETAAKCKTALERSKWK